MAVMSITMFVGITLLAHAYGIVPNDAETVVSQIARATFGGRGWPYYAVQASTMAILVLAANTAYADFPTTRVDPRARPLPAAPVHESGRSSRLFERHPDPQRARWRCCSWCLAATRMR